MSRTSSDGVAAKGHKVRPKVVFCRGDVLHGEDITAVLLLATVFTYHSYSIMWHEAIDDFGRYLPEE